MFGLVTKKNPPRRTAPTRPSDHCRAKLSSVCCNCVLTDTYVHLAFLAYEGEDVDSCLVVQALHSNWIRSL